MEYDKLLRVRKRRERCLQVRTAELQSAAEQLNCHCRNLRGLWKKAAAQLRREVQEHGGESSADTRMRERNLTEHRERGRRRYRRVSEKLNRVRRKLRRAMRSRRLLEKLRQRRLRRTRRKRALVEQRGQDCFSAQRYWQRMQRR